MSDLSAEELAFFDEAVARLRMTRRTFTEQDALQKAWDNDYELVLTFDPRFIKAYPGNEQLEPHWRLDIHTLANNRLLHDLQEGLWDGRQLDERLAHMDHAEQRHYIFFDHDPRFIHKHGRWELTAERNLTLPPELKSELDDHIIDLQMYWRASANQPWTVAQIAEILTWFGWHRSEMINASLYLRSWLLESEHFQRVGLDYWVPADSIPQEVRRSYIAVPPIHGQSPDTTPPYPDNASPHSLTAFPLLTPPERLQEDQPDPDDLPVNLIGDMTHIHTEWRISLRSIHRAEGFIRIPKAAHDIYPPLAHGEHGKTVIRSNWYEDGTMFWTWLDRQKHRLYGPDLKEKLSWQDTGDIIRIEWKPDLIIFHIIGHDDRVQREETRLIDPEELKELRRGIGESYRASLQAILTAAPDGMTFNDLQAALIQRQGHEVKRESLRSILYSSGFIQRNKHWYAAPNSTLGAQHLRKALLETIVPPQDHQPEDHQPQHPPTPTTYIRTRAKAIHKRLTEITQTLRPPNPIT